MIQQATSLKVLILPLSLAIVVVVAIFFVKPAYSEMMTAKNSLAEKNAQLENLNKQNQSLQSVKSKWDAMGDEKTLVASAVPDDKGVDSFVSEISSKASRSGVLLSDIKSDSQKSAGAADGGTSAYVCGASEAIAGQAYSAPAANISDAENLPGSASPLGNCLNDVNFSMSVKGSWQQMLDFFKYLEDMNRISNIGAIKISSESQTGQASAGLLNAEISLSAFFKGRSANEANLAGALASQGNFNQKAIEKLKEVIYTPYSAPAVSPGGERNIFE